MNKYLITLIGCDDTTECEIELTKQQLETFMQIAKKINEKSTYQCEPYISIFENYKKDDDGYLQYWGEEYIDLLESEENNGRS